MGRQELESRLKAYEEICNVRRNVQKELLKYLYNNTHDIINLRWGFKEFIEFNNLYVDMNATYCASCYALRDDLPIFACFYLPDTNVTSALIVKHKYQEKCTYPMYICMHDKHRLIRVTMVLCVAQLCGFNFRLFHLVRLLFAEFSSNCRVQIWLEIVVFHGISRKCDKHCRNLR